MAGEGRRWLPLIHRMQAFLQEVEAMCLQSGALPAAGRDGGGPRGAREGVSHIAQLAANPLVFSATGDVFAGRGQILAIVWEGVTVSGDRAELRAGGGGRTWC